MCNNKNYIIGGLVFLGVVLLMATSVLAAPTPSSSFEGDPTEVPPAPVYYLGPTYSFTPYGVGVDNVDLEDIPIPTHHYTQLLGWVIYVAGDNYSEDAGDMVLIKAPGNTIWDIDHKMGQMICLDNDDYSCGAVGFSDGGWTQKYTTPPDITIWFQDTGDGIVSFTMQPIFWGIREDDCEQPDPDDLPVIGQNCLAGTNETGDTYDLDEDSMYYLVIADDTGWNDGTNERWDMGISFDEGATWTAARLAAGEEDDIEDACASEFDNQVLAIAITGSAERETLTLRVNDTDGSFGDNSGDLCYTLYAEGGAGGPGSCGYALSSNVIEGDVRADDWDGEVIFAPWPPDETMAIEIGPPSWTIAGGQTSTDVDVMAQEDPAATWTNLWNYPGLICVEEWGEDHYVYYTDLDPYYADHMYHRIRASGADQASYSSHTGTVNYALYGAQMMESTDCSTRYELGEFVRSGTIESFMRDGGYEIFRTEDHGLTPGRLTIMIQTSGGPFVDGAVEHYDLQINTTGGILDSWTDIYEWANCVDPVDGDPNHYKYYVRDDFIFGSSVLMRAKENSGSWTDNSGSVDYSLYIASDLMVRPGYDCDDQYELGSTLDTQSVSAASETGAAIEYYLVPNEHYAIEVSTGAVWDVDGDGYDDRQVQIKGSGDWYNLADWPGTICSEQHAEGYDRIYFRAGDVTPQLRAADPGGVWGDNVGTVIWHLKSAEYLGIYSDVTCETNYKNMYSNWIEMEMINPQTSTGRNVSIIEGGVYALYTTDGPWFDQGNVSYAVEISDDGGNTWTALENYDSPCIVPTGDGGYYTKIYIDTAVSSAYKLRVADTDLGFLNNTGEIWYQLLEFGDEPFEDGYAPPVNVPGGFFNGCNSICLRPSSWLMVGQWIDYAACNFSKFISWCPYHNDMIEAMPALFDDREPVATVRELQDIMSEVENEVNAYTWAEDTGGAGAPTVGSPDNFIFGADQGGSGQSPFAGTGPYSGEPVVFDMATVSYSANCTNLLADHMGNLMAPGMCFALDALDHLGLTSWYQFFWDIFMLLTLTGYTYSRWINAFVG